VVLAFAGGAVLASLVDTLFPNAYKHGGPWVALATVAGDEDARASGEGISMCLPRWRPL
jgi:hypothetical protein